MSASSPLPRWQLRLQSLERAMALLNRALAIPQPDETQEAGIVQFFEVAFELAWKTLKDYLEATQGLAPAAPRQVLQQAFAYGLLADGHTWIDALERRNLLAHTYDEAHMREALHRIRHQYAPLLTTLLTTLPTRS